ncbi:MAG TPA: AsmA family protein, partial [Geminicoccaceae bacterium]|nr:AsmA family protein [Geminicoccaceae bacterium]
MSRRRKWLLWPVVALAAIVVVVLVLFDWNWLKGPIEGWVSAELGRDVEIAGDLDVDLALQPRITVTDVRLANPPWASDEPMLALARAEAVVDLRALIDGEVRLPELSVSEPVLRLETRPDGPPNWEFPSEEPAGPPSVPYIGRLRIEGAAVHYLEHGSGRSVDAELAEVTGSTDAPEGGMQLAATGTVQGEPLELRLSGPPAAQLERPSEAYPLALDLKLGESDLVGDVELALGGDVPAISARLRSDQVKTTDLAWLTGEAAEPPVEEALDEAIASAEQALEEVQDEPAAATGEETPAAADTADAATRTWFDFDQLPALEADLDYSIGHLEGPSLRLQDVSLQAGLHDRLPTLALSGNGTYQDQPIVLDVKAGPAEGEQQAQVPYRIDARIEAGQTQITATGGIQQPERLQGVQVDFAVQSADATELLRQLGLPAPALPELQVEGELVREGQVWQLNDGYARVGESELSGEFSADLSQARPFVRADLTSRRLRMADFVPVREGEAENGGAETGETPEDGSAEPSVPLIKDGDINLEALPEIDADIELAADHVEVPEFLFDRLQVDLRLRDRVAVIDA